MVSRKDLIRVLPYLGKTPLDLKAKKGRAIEENLPYCELK